MVAGELLEKVWLADGVGACTALGRSGADTELAMHASTPDLDNHSRLA